MQALERTPQEYLGESTFQDYLDNFIKPERILGDEEERVSNTVDLEDL